MLGTWKSSLVAAVTGGISSDAELLLAAVGAVPMTGGVELALTASVLQTSLAYLFQFG